MVWLGHRVLARARRNPSSPNRCHQQAMALAVVGPAVPPQPHGTPPADLALRPARRTATRAPLPFVGMRTGSPGCAASVAVARKTGGGFVPHSTRRGAHGSGGPGGLPSDLARRPASDIGQATRILAPPPAMSHPGDTKYKHHPQIWHCGPHDENSDPSPAPLCGDANGVPRLCRLCSRRAENERRVCPAFYSPWENTRHGRGGDGEAAPAGRTRQSKRKTYKYSSRSRGRRGSRPGCSRRWRWTCGGARRTGSETPAPPRPSR